MRKRGGKEGMRERERDGGKEGEMRREVGGRGGGEGCRSCWDWARERSNQVEGSLKCARRHKSSQLTTCLAHWYNNIVL